MKIVYLDQNKWIELSRTHYGRGDRSLSPVIDFLKRSRELRLACFPLSLTHYMETHKHRDPDARSRLAKFMLGLSGGQTLIDLGHITRFELENALFRLFPHRVRADQIPQLNLLGWGVFHSAGKGSKGMKLSGPSLERIPRKLSSELELTATLLMEQALLSGVMPFTKEEAPRAPDSDAPQRFRDHLEHLKIRVGSLGRDLRERTLYAISMVDILEPLNDALEKYNISREEFEALGIAGFCSLLDNMPTRRVDIHIQRQWAKNPSLKSRLSDLNDMGILAPASIYCDVLVTEKQFADLVQRDGFQCNARILTDLHKLPEVLVGLN
jgi:hypothetical protein